MFAAAETYPSYVDQVARALDSAIPEVSVMSGYRAYAEEQHAANPAWQGVPMEADQTYVVVIGRVP